MREARVVGTPGGTGGEATARSRGSGRGTGGWHPRHGVVVDRPCPPVGGNSLRVLWIDSIAGVRVVMGRVSDAGAGGS